MTASSSIRILVIEDEPAIADTLVYALRTEGFAPEWRATGREGLAAFDAASAISGVVGDTASGAAGGAAGGATGSAVRDTLGVAGAFALVILDVGLPDMSGFDVCRALGTRASVPVLFLTARSSEIDRVVGLELGGDDYVTKPFSPREVTARVRAILRRTQAASGANAPVAITATAATVTASPASVNAVGASLSVASSDNGQPKLVCNLLSDKPAGGAHWQVDVECKIAAFRGVRLELTRYEFRLLAVLHSRPGRVWSRDELMTRVWEDPGASLDRTVDAHIKTLRGKLRAIEADEDPIQTHRGEGYSLRLPS